MATKDKQSRKYQLTINNPQEKGLDHDAIKKALEQLTALDYYCLGDEIGQEGTPHTHVFVTLRNATRFSRLKRLFPEAHIEAAKGTIQENRDYVAKSGKWADDPKSDTSVPGTFEESGEPPKEPGQGARSDIALIYQQIEEGIYWIDNKIVLSWEKENKALREGTFTESHECPAGHTFLKNFFNWHQRYQVTQNNE